MCFCLYSRTFIVSPAMRSTEFQSDLRLCAEQSVWLTRSELSRHAIDCLEILVSNETLNSALSVVRWCWFFLAMERILTPRSSSRFGDSLSSGRTDSDETEDERQLKKDTIRWTTTTAVTAAAAVRPAVNFQLHDAAVYGPTTTTSITSNSSNSSGASSTSSNGEDDQRSHDTVLTKHGSPTMTHGSGFELQPHFNQPM